MLSRPTSPTGCSDAVFITEEDLEGYETYADDGKDVVEVQVVVRHKPIMRKLSCEPSPGPGHCSNLVDDFAMVAFASVFRSYIGRV